MRVKIGQKWFAVEPGQPIMIEFSDGDKRNIAQMLPEATRYACFADDDPLVSNEEKLKWMSEGAEAAT
ncbi:hypothetical protein MesoLjLc_51540 [Mesorhizobium sp. L-8-10]|uniref:hypothetical protein n=1 Tax=Mesorhizobium sp. L-8-10 TaxID=2744523 RepID=UPI00192694EF|nr:hypothetical protein [Mesorhizobium sp. L-8-10]BCH33224.1 hypothetical protein MesoLjLc_51540 [Mesorhizobium sp. L-8-10]